MKKISSFTKEPITEPLHPLRSSTLSNIAVEIFKHILAYIYYKDLVNPSGDLKYAEVIISYGLERSSLREEIYCQLIKQSNIPKEKLIQNNNNNNNQHVNIAVKVWELISMCVGCFAPSQYFLKYLQNYIHDTLEAFPVDSPISIIANYSKDRLEKILLYGKRLFVPTPLELRKVKVIFLFSLLFLF